MNKVFIVIFETSLSRVVESVWTTKKLAESAIKYYKEGAIISSGQFIIIERELNTAKKSENE